AITCSLPQSDIIAITNDDCRADEQGQGQCKQPACTNARSLPLFQSDSPEAAEDDDAGHMQRPTGELVPSHLGFAHGVEVELKIPRGAVQSAEQILRHHGHSHNPEFDSWKLLRQHRSPSLRSARKLRDSPAAGTPAILPVYL